MGKFSIIDIGKEDFIRDINGNVFILFKNDEIEVQNWLLENGDKFGWTKSGVEFYNWNKFLDNNYKKFKKLNFISLKETDKLDNIECFWYNTENQNVKGYTKYVSCCSLEIDNINLLQNIIKDNFIRNVYNIMKKDNIINIENKLLHKIDITQIIDNCLDDFIITYPTFKNNDRFIIISENLKEKNLVDFSMFDNGLIISDKIENEIIFGFKTNENQPGIILISNEDGLNNKNNIRFAISEIGYNPSIPYFKITIN